MAGNVVAGGIVEIFRNYTSCLAVIGAISVTCISLKTLFAIWGFVKEYFLSPILGLGVDLKSFGPWAVVTGSTDGIGKEYALQLAKRGLNIVLISRSPDKLKAVAQEIDKYKVETKFIAVDFSGGPEIYDRISADLSNLEIGILVNNVGMSHSFPQFFAEMSNEQEIRNMININCNSVTFMTKIVLPQMIARKKGIIINLSSVSGTIPQPLLSVYSATKAYIDFFSRALTVECKAKGVIVQSLTPGFVVTKLSKFRSASLLVPTPASFVRSALAAVGVTTRTPGYWTHGLQFAGSTVIPEWLFYILSMKVMLGARRRALAKLQKSQ
jgi:17beta-estradiol 17-dehydrogenase / very-long-chain 3-oxoacyl-CoA reductase